MNKNNFIKSGYELVRIILDKNYENPYYFFVKKKERNEVIDKIIECFTSWVVEKLYQSDCYAYFDDYLNYFIKKNKLIVYKHNIEEFVWENE